MTTDRAIVQQEFDQALAKLKGKQHTFALEILKGKSGRDAAIAAGYSERTATVKASQLLTIVNVFEAVEAGRKLAAHDAVMDAQEVLELLTRHARGSLGDFLRVDEEEITLTWSLMQLPTNEDGEPSEAAARFALAFAQEVRPTDRVLRTETITRAVARLDLMAAGQAGKLGLVKKYTLDEKGKVSIELYDAQAAAVQLGKHHGLFIERQEITGKDGQPIEVQDARSRLLDRLARRARDADEGGTGEPAG